MVTFISAFWRLHAIVQIEKQKGEKYQTNELNLTIFWEKKENKEENWQDLKDPWNNFAHFDNFVPGSKAFQKRLQKISPARGVFWLSGMLNMYLSFSFLDIDSTWRG